MVGPGSEKIPLDYHLGALSRDRGMASKIQGDITRALFHCLTYINYHAQTAQQRRYSITQTMHLVSRKWHRLNGLGAHERGKDSMSFLGLPESLL
ncbi:hypothetical protein K439DRAFT_872293 [Ramaria rubella]|nr:hypothetical protein K439DRAFT_872293 [Ramaria rubella]